MSTATLINNATIVANMYEAFGRGDIPSIINNVADNCKWIGAGEGSLPEGGIYKGKEAVNFLCASMSMKNSILSTLFQSITLVTMKYSLSET